MRLCQKINQFLDKKAILQLRQLKKLYECHKTIQNQSVSFLFSKFKTTPFKS